MQGREHLCSRLSRQREPGDHDRVEGLPLEQGRAIAEVSRLARGRHWQDALLLLGSVPDPVPKLQAAALDACAKALELGQAQQLFDQMKEKTVPAFNIMINLHGRLKKVHVAEELLLRMREGQLKPTAVTHGCMINAYGMTHDSGAVMRVLEEMQREGLRLTEVTFGSAIAAVARGGDKTLVGELLARMEDCALQPGLGHLTSAITSCAISKDETRARAAFEEIRRRGHRPDLVAYTSLLACLPGTPEGLAGAEALVAEMRGEGISADTFIYNQLVSIAIEAGRTERARALLGEMEAAGLPPSRETRMRVGQLEAAERQAALRAPAPAASGAAGRADAPLPAGWRETLDPASGRPYFWAEADPAGSATWQRPAPAAGA